MNKQEKSKETNKEPLDFGKIIINILEKLSHFTKWLLIITGIIFLGLSWWLPYHIDQMREHDGGGASAYFTPGFESLKEALTSLITSFSIFTSISIAFIVLPIENRRKKVSLFLSSLTLVFFSVGVIFSLYLSIIRPLSGTPPSPQNVYWSLRLLLLGLGFLIFTIASFISEFILNNENITHEHEQFKTN